VQPYFDQTLLLLGIMMVCTLGRGESHANARRIPA
jgi:hypothetical protein